MTQEQQQLEQAIENVNQIVSMVKCDRQTGEMLYAAWQLIVETARKVAQPKSKGKSDGAT